MREIKFRAWHTALKKMFSAEEMAEDQLTLLTIGKFINVSSESTKLSVIIDEMIPLQFTGLKDENGKEIYEGDVVKDSFDRIMQVKWWNYRLCWVAISETNFHHADLFDWCEKDENYDRTDVARVQVIGNIHENPELLNKVNQ
jgi:uncharacterized phage protein (TIGR01671 family)